MCRLFCDGRRFTSVLPYLVFVAGAVQNWRYRHAIYPDGIQYLDVARQLLAGDLAALINPVWSPVYPAMIAVFLAPLLDAPYWWWLAVQLANLVSYALALWQFHAWLRELLAGHSITTQSRPGVLLYSGAFAVFTLVVMHLANVRTMTPDMLVAAVMFFCARQLVRAGTSTRVAGAPLAAALAIGYAVKAVVFPTAVITFGMLLLTSSGGAERRRWLRTATIFGVMCLPLVVATSIRAQRLTFGESGRIVYGWYVQNKPFLAVGTRDGYELRQVCGRDDTYTWTFPARVTYAPFYDPSFWRANESTHFSLAAQGRAMPRIGEELAGIGLGLLPLLPGFLVLLSSRPIDLKAFAMSRHALVLAAVAIAIYFPVHVETRFLSAPLVILLSVTLFALRPRAGDRFWRIGLLLLWGGAAAAAGPPVAGAIRNTVLDVRDGESREMLGPWQAAEAAAALDISAGTAVAVLGGTNLDYGWAQLARVRIIAQTFARDDEFNARNDLIRDLERCFQTLGVTAVVGPTAAAPAGARAIGSGLAMWRIGHEF